MTEHALFYFPYANFNDEQLPLLKAAALYFDRLVVLDPAKANWALIGFPSVLHDAVTGLTDAGILKVIEPSSVLTHYADDLARAIEADLGDPEFIKICARHAAATGKTRWTLALSKVPTSLLAEGVMSRLMGEFAGKVASRAGRSSGFSYAESVPVLDEYRESDIGPLEYRYADYPLPLGEAIMINHALFTGLLHAGATPVTTEQFHSDVLALKLRRAKNDPALRVLEDRARRRAVRSDLLAVETMIRPELRLPTLSPDLPIDIILQHRADNADALGQVRDKLAKLAWAIKAEPWSSDFFEHVDAESLPALAKDIDEARKARDSWLGSNRFRLALKGAGVAGGAASVFLSLVLAPLTPIALATAAVGLAVSAGIPAAEMLLDVKDGKKDVELNGLQYLLSR